MIIRAAVLVAVLCFGPATVLAGQTEQYLCIADLVTGFFYDEDSKKWKQTTFNTDDSKYVISQPDAESPFEVTRIGLDFSSFLCRSDNPIGFLACESILFGTFLMNKTTGRFLASKVVGYVNSTPSEDSESDAPHLEIGKCSPF